MSSVSSKSPGSPATIASDSSQPSTPTTPPSEPTSDGSSKPKSLRYKVASHSVRITKVGYAIEPVELRYQEIRRALSLTSRRASEASFDSAQVGHQVLSLIRGFWSQPGFPKGRVVLRQDKNVSLEYILSEFSQNPLYPHREIFGSAAEHKRRSRVVRRRLSASDATKQSKGKSPPATSPPETDSDPLAKSIKDKFKPIISADDQNVAPTEMPNSGSKSILASMFATKTRPPDHMPQRAANNNYHSWIPTDKKQISELLKQLCHQMEQLFSNEPRVVRIASPCTVLGDIHGNLSDLRIYERSLWPKAPVCVSSNYLFLGDYVDRGEYSVECVLYLFAMKLISPTRFFLLRGNHEVASIQRQYTFSRECELKFGSQGKQIWKNFNKVFNVMPVAAVIDDQIFCAHGGIPRSITDIKQLAKEIPSPLDNPETQCPAAWEILWNDPITDSELIGMIEMDNAVVTQTQIMQTQALPDGQEQVTTTSSTSIASEPKTSPNTAAESATTKNSGGAPNADRLREEQERGLNEADTILTREPSVALSFYIKPEEPATDTSSKKPVGAAAKEAAESSSNDDTSKDDTKLRTVPSDTSSIASTTAQEIINDGFVANIKRGTAFLFSDQAINNFLRVNQLSHVIRAHEVIPTGFAFHGDGRVITIFSSSRYCGLNNQAACALVDQDRIRILRLDTGDAAE